MKARRLSREQESALHQEVLVIWNEQHKIRMKSLIKIALSPIYNEYKQIEEQLCSEWGRSNN